MLDTLPQHQSTKEAWYHAGPEFQQGQTRFRTYGNDFDAGVVLPEYIGPRPLNASMHITTNTEPPDIRVDDNDAIPLRSVDFATAGFYQFQFRRTRAGLRLEKELGPGVVAPPRKARPLSGSTEIECDSTDSFPGTGVDKVSEPPETHKFTGSTKSESISRVLSPSKRIGGSSPSRESPYFSVICESKSRPNYLKRHVAYITSNPSYLVFRRGAATTSNTKQHTLCLSLSLFSPPLHLI